MLPNRSEADPIGTNSSTGAARATSSRRSTLKFTRNPITGQIHIATPEESAAFDKHCDSYRESLAPVGAIEQELAQEIAEGHWRLKRAPWLEKSIAAGSRQPIGHSETDAALDETKLGIERSRQIHLLTLYESRIRRTIEKNVARLKAIQAEREGA